MGQPPKSGDRRSAAKPGQTLGDIAGRESGALIVLLVAIGGLTLASPDFLTGNNLANLARQVAIFGILAIGQLFVILTGGIDLSVGSILGLSGAVTAQLLVAGFPIIPLAILIGIVVGGVLGIVNGLLVTRFKLPPFIATLGMLGIARGIVLVITDANTIQGLPDSFQDIANGTVLGDSQPADHLPRSITAVAWFVLNRTVFGRYVYSVGSNPEAARLAGVPVAVGHHLGVRDLRPARRRRRCAADVPARRGHPHRRHRFRTAGDRRLCHRRSQPVRRARQRHRRRLRRADHRRTEQRRKPVGHQLVLSADRHRRPRSWWPSDSTR